MVEKSESPNASKTFTDLFKSMFREMRANALWDLVKVVAFYLVPPLLFYFRIIPFETIWLILVGIVWIIFLPIGYSLFKRRVKAEAGIRERELQTKLDAKEAELEKALLAKNDSETKSTLELAKEQAKVKAEFNEKAQLYEQLYKEKEAVVNQWNDNYWLIERAEEQARSIADWVVLDKFFFSAIRKEPIPKVSFLFLLRNNSIFDVTLEDEIAGKIEYYGTDLLREKLFSSTPEVVRSCGFGWFNFEHRLSHEEYDLIITKDSPGECLFDISKLQFTIKGLRPEVASQRLKIPPRFRTYFYDDYKADLEKYEYKGR